MNKKYYIITNTPRRMGLKFPAKETLPIVDWDLELSVNNYYAATTIILAGLIHGNSQIREKIINSLHKVSSWPLFREYLLDNLIKDLKANLQLEITDEYIFDKIVPFYSEKYNSLPDRHSVRGHLANTAQALALNPTLDQIEKALAIIQRTVEWQEKEGHDYQTVMQKFKKKNKDH